MRHGWFHTGDIARRDEEGYLYIVDRVKDMIIRGGFNVYPREIEEVLMTHPAVSLAAVIGVPHDRHGEEVKAFVIVKDGATITEVELVAWSKQNMADYKYPRHHRVPYRVAHDGHGQGVEERTALVRARKAAASRWRRKER